MWGTVSAKIPTKNIRTIAVSKLISAGIIVNTIKATPKVMAVMPRANRLAFALSES